MSEELSLSEELRRAREGRGESLDQVQQRTGISWRILQALEEGDLEAVEAVYMRMGLLRYASYLGLDGQALAQGLGGPRSRERVPARIPPPWGGPVLGDGLIKWAAGLAVAAVGAVIYLMATGETDPAPPSVPVVDELAAAADPSAWEQPVGAEPATGARVDVTGEAPRSAAATGSAITDDAASSAHLFLEGEAFGTVWVEVSWDDLDSAMETIPAGERRTWTAERFFRVHVGRPGNIRFRFQGRLLGEGRLGDPDQTLRFRVSEDGYQLLGPDFEPIAPLTRFQPERTESSQPEAR